MKTKNYSQCPGEVYDDFWEEENNQPTINLDELLKNKSWDEERMEWYDTNTQYCINYHKKGDLTIRRKYCKTMHNAIAKAYEMIQSEDYIITSITTEYPDIGQE